MNIVRIKGMIKVLRSLDYDRHRIKVIIAEMTGEKDGDGKTMDDFMRGAGYGLYRKCGSNVIYVRKRNGCRKRHAQLQAGNRRLGTGSGKAWEGR